MEFQKKSVNNPQTKHHYFHFKNITNHVFSSKSTVFFKNSSLDINLGYLYNDRKEFEEHHEEMKNMKMKF